MRLPIVMLIAIAQARRALDSSWCSPSCSWRRVDSRMDGRTSTETTIWTCSSDSSRAKPNRLYRNDGGRFVEVAGAAGIADVTDTRAAAWGDFDGDVDLYLEVTSMSKTGRVVTVSRLSRPVGVFSR